MNAQAELRPLPLPGQPDLPSLILIGDSTVRNGDGDGGNGEWGWGDPLAELFDPQEVNVVNRAVGGLSSRTYISAGYWHATHELIRPGDVVVIQFGHNDDGPINDDHRARGTLRGTGEESEAIDNNLTKKHEVVYTYGWYLRLYIKQIRERGGVPVLCSPVPRKKWDDLGKVKRADESYGGWAQEVAEAEGALFIDLNALIADEYDTLGPDAVEPLFADEHTHTSRAGAELNARLVMAGLRALLNETIDKWITTHAMTIVPASDERVSDNRKD